MKRLSFLFTAAAVLTLCFLTVPIIWATGNDDKAATIQLEADGRLVQLQHPLQIVGQTALIHPQDAAAWLQAELNWQNGKQALTLSKGQTALSFTLGQTSAVKNGQTVPLQTAPLKLNGEMHIPLRTLAAAFGYQLGWDGDARKITVTSPESGQVSADGLPVVGSYEQFRSIVQRIWEQNSLRAAAGLSLAIDVAATEAESGATAGEPAESAAAGEAAESRAEAGMEKTPARAPQYSATNVQTQGVDEADLIKTDGTYLYQIKTGRLIISKIVPAEEMEVVSFLTFADGTFVPREMFVDGKHLVVIGSRREVYVKDIPYGKEQTQIADEAAAMSMEKKKLPPSETVILPAPAVKQEITAARVYDITNPAAPELIRELEAEGYYLSSRKIGPYLYFATNRHIDAVRIMNSAEEIPGPAYRDSAAGQAVQTIPYEQIRYFPEAAEPNFLLVAGVNLDHPDQPMEVSAYLGSGENIYASKDHLYVAVTREEIMAKPVMPPAVEEAERPSAEENEGKDRQSMDNGVTGSAADAAFFADEPAEVQINFEPSPDSEMVRVKRISPSATLPAVVESKTLLYKFALNEGKVEFAAEGSVPGRILNQFSMDEFAGNLRIATTSGEMWRSDEHTSKNHLYVLDSSLKLKGKMENIAPGEKIYSVRFMGSRAYMVTFRTVDPLFVIDLSSPEQPKILGSLKIPGYSDYLHPYDEHHLIGFGKETAEADMKDGRGRTVGTNAYQLGMKIAVFDVSDVTRPTEKFKQIIGGRGTDSELLRDHKALLFSREKELLAFPVTVMEVQGSQWDEYGFPRYGQFAFQGAYVYRLNMEKGFELLGTITHLTEEEQQKAGQYGADSSRQIRRILYVDDTLYTVSDSKIQANDIRTLEKVNELHY